MSSLSPYSRASIIYDIDFGNEAVTIAQPLTPFSKNTAFKELHLTTIIHDKNRKMRVGVECSHFKLIDQFTLANKTNVPAVLLKYELPAKEINIRSAFRLPLSTKYIIKGKILYNDLEYSSSRDFSIRDVSLGGLGLVVPKKRNNNLNPLGEIKINEKIVIGIVLINLDQDKPVGTLPLKTQIARINSNYSSTHSLVGLKILSLESNYETILSKFIHDAQIDELKRMSRINL
ncbi:MAG: PilZ domain-containing protein [Desulfobacula sp.]|uniref:PilZ domain-containing protein n=1 Tax=Desulfobacula sp. TaxID=2593537 RepID=UPI0025BAAFC2|nr:PilZ domain-containing protein [Desulfobacula sp.]MCD4718319.1 PilZ domain-containing protein [Desulfobacula sp.]